MRARTHGSRFLSALAAAALLGACGSGLYDATGVPKLANGGGTTCDPNNPNAILCTVAGVPDTCTDSNVSHCGQACADCTASAPPGNGTNACLGVGNAAVCGYTCATGFIKCAAGCCSATAVAAAERSTCALLTGGEAACWGANDTGQVGDGATAAAQTTPKLVALGAGVTASAIATGGTHACAIVANGAVKCWGANDAGQVTGTSSGAPVLSPVDTPVASGATAVAAGTSHTCALLGNGSVRCWGAAAAIGPGSGAPISSGATAIAAGRSHTCALVGGGAIRCWGSNASGQLGASPSGGIASPPMVQGVAMALLAAGADQTCAATGTVTSASIDPSLQCWGDSVGAGYGFSSPQAAPAIPLKSGTQSTIKYAIERLSVGANFACVKRSAEGVECLGANDVGQLGGTPAGAGETAAVGLSTFPTGLASGSTHSCAVLPDGRLQCWGRNDAGQLGDGSTNDPGLGIIVTPIGG